MKLGTALCDGAVAVCSLQSLYCAFFVAAQERTVCNRCSTDVERMLPVFYIHCIETEG
jgi:hypothetical protein